MSQVTSVPIILICGFGRCGTSLMMQMLAAGGIPVIGKSPTYEEKPPEKADVAYWQEHYAGRAIKVLDPHRKRPPAGPEYRIVWLDRDPVQQALSQIKFMQALGLVGKLQMPEKVAAKKLMRLNAAQRPRALAILHGLAGRQNCSQVMFEHLLQAPHLCAKQLWDKFGQFSTRQHLYPHTVIDMAEVVRFRGPENYPGIMEMNLPGMAA